MNTEVLIELGSRSLMEPFCQRNFSSFVGEHFMGRNFSDKQITYHAPFDKYDRVEDYKVAWAY